MAKRHKYCNIETATLVLKVIIVIVCLGVLVWTAQVSVRRRDAIFALVLGQTSCDLWPLL